MTRIVVDPPDLQLRSADLQNISATLSAVSQRLTDLGNGAPDYNNGEFRQLVQWATYTPAGAANNNSQNLSTLSQRLRDIAQRFEEVDSTQVASAAYGLAATGLAARPTSLALGLRGYALSSLDGISKVTTTGLDVYAEAGRGQARSLGRFAPARYRRAAGGVFSQAHRVLNTPLPGVKGALRTVNLARPQKAIPKYVRHVKQGALGQLTAGTAVGVGIGVVIETIKTKDQEGLQRAAITATFGEVAALAAITGVAALAAPVVGVSAAGIVIGYGVGLLALHAYSASLGALAHQGSAIGLNTVGLQHLSEGSSKLANETLDVSHWTNKAADWGWDRIFK